jgi:energy-coupling factor transporter ATP-binding protein EcfA2
LDKEKSAIFAKKSQIIFFLAKNPRLVPGLKQAYVMFAEFGVQNFRSVKEKQTFSLVASKDKSLLEENTFAIGKNRLLKTAVLYGANASGKSNLFRALSFFLEFATSSFRQETGVAIKTEPFLFDTRTKDEDSGFECIFYLDGKRYGFGVNATRISHEYLFSIQKVQEVYMFTRELQDIKVSPTYFKEGTSRRHISRENATFLAEQRSRSDSSGDLSEKSQDSGRIPGPSCLFVGYAGRRAYQGGTVGFPQVRGCTGGRPENRESIAGFLWISRVRIETCIGKGVREQRTTKGFVRDPVFRIRGRSLPGLGNWRDMPDRCSGRWNRDCLSS